jgi:hypothetical protein
MGNAPVFLQSPSSAGMYPPVSASVAPPVKYSSSAYKTDDNAGSQTHVRIPGAYAVYGSSSSVYSNNAVVMNGTSVETDDVTGSQFKESNVFVAGQQVTFFLSLSRKLSSTQLHLYLKSQFVIEKSKNSKILM